MRRTKQVRRGRRSLALMVVLAVVAAGLALSPSSAAASAPSAAPAATASPAERATVDPSFPSSWPQHRPRVQNPANRVRLAMDAQYSGGHGAPVWLWPANGGDAQLWVQENAAEGGVFLHPGYNRWLCLGVNTTGWGSQVFVQNCNGSANQRWWVDWNVDQIRSVPGNLCIDVPSSNFVQGQMVQLWGCNSSAAQRWIRHAMGRSDSRNEPVFYVGGYTDTEGHNCTGDYWGEAINAMRGWGWTGALRTIGFYRNDVNCSDQIVRVDRQTGIDEIGRQVAWHIYNTYSHRRISVDVISHSMGGLIIRAAINGVRTGQPESNRWPPYLYIEDVVTLSTPHTGTGWANLCTPVQCQQLRSGSAFLNGLAANPQSQQGTDWTLIGAGDDDTIEVGSALGMNAGHQINYLCCHGGLEHSQLPHTVNGTFPIEYWNHHDPGVWYAQGNGAAPIRAASNALYSWTTW